MPSLTWKLKDSKNCEGCPKYMLAHDDEWICLEEFTLEDEDSPSWYSSPLNARPQACIDALGE